MGNAIVTFLIGVFTGSAAPIIASSLDQRSKRVDRDEHALAEIGDAVDHLQTSTQLLRASAANPPTPEAMRDRIQAAIAAISTLAVVLHRHRPPGKTLAYQALMDDGSALLVDAIDFLMPAMEAALPSVLFPNTRPSKLLPTSEHVQQEIDKFLAAATRVMNSIDVRRARLQGHATRWRRHHA